MKKLRNRMLLALLTASLVVSLTAAASFAEEEVTQEQVTEEQSAVTETYDGSQTEDREPEPGLGDAAEEETDVPGEITEDPAGETGGGQPGTEEPDPEEETPDADGEDAEPSVPSDEITEEIPDSGDETEEIQDPSQETEETPEAADGTEETEPQQEPAVTPALLEEEEEPELLPEEEKEENTSVTKAAAKAKIKLSSAEIPHEWLTYTGKARTQTVNSVVKAIVNGKEKVLTRYQDYKISYQNNINVGTASVTFTGKGDYTGSITKTFLIRPAKTALTTVAPGTGKLTVKWKKVADQTDGYQIQYSPKSDFSSSRKTITVADSAKTAKVLKNVAAGKSYYVRVRTFKTVDGRKIYSTWSSKHKVSMAWNLIYVSGSGITRKVEMVNPKAVYNRVQVDIWSDTGGKDDVHCYTMKKNAEGTWRVEILTGYLSHYGTCYAECFYGKTSLSTKKFTVSKEDHDASKNTLVVGGSGVSRAIRLSNPASSYKNVYAAVWSQEGGQDDMKWLALEKQENGSWYLKFSTVFLTHSGKCNVHVYANDQSVFLGSETFNCTLTNSAIQWNPSWEFADYSKVHTGTAKLYRASTNRKGIVVGINSGHGTILPAGQDNYVYSHPDKTPKTTGGSTAAGAVWTICDNTGMSFNDGTPEAQVTLEQGLILRDVLLDAGYDVIVIRENNDSGLDVIARTVICNELADCHISLHWDGDGLGYDKGIFYMSVPDAIKGMYPTSTVWSRSDHFGECLISGLRAQGLPIFSSGSMQMDLMQTSYSKVPSIDIELGNQSSTHTQGDLQRRAQGLLAGINLFFNQ